MPSIGAEELRRMNASKAARVQVGLLEQDMEWCTVLGPLIVFEVNTGAESGIDGRPSRRHKAIQMSLQRPSCARENYIGLGRYTGIAKKRRECLADVVPDIECQIELYIVVFILRAWEAHHRMNTLYSIRSYKPNSKNREMIRRGVVSIAVAGRERFPQTLGTRDVSWIVMGPLHSSRSDTKVHWTIRGVTGDGQVISTIHLYPEGSPTLFNNGGRWQKYRMRLDVRWRGTPL
ncbi:hypothetical protein BD779DRAFT_1477264 [Infundibulicybe gibba]|nr:hypothetical protein BD779DRAFT_1477264 [Infundibulicybe gibba]